MCGTPAFHGGSLSPLPVKTEVPLWRRQREHVGVNMQNRGLGILPRSNPPVLSRSNTGAALVQSNGSAYGYKV